MRDTNRRKATGLREDRALCQAELEDKLKKIEAVARNDSGSSRNGEQMVNRLEAEARGIKVKIDGIEAEITTLDEVIEADPEEASATGRRMRSMVPATAPVAIDPEASTRRGADNRGGHILAEGIRALTGASGLGQVITPPEHAQQVLDHLAAQSVGLQSGFTVVSTEHDTLEIPHSTSDGTASWTAEAAAITAGDVGAEVISAVPRKLAALQQTSNEVINDAHPSVLEVLFNRLTRAMALKLDLGFYEGTGTPPEIRGLKNVAGIGSVSLGTNGAIPANLDPWADALGLLEQQNAHGSAIVMHPRTWQTLSKVKEITGSTKPVLQESAGSGSQGIERRLYGVPVYLSSQVSITETQGTSGAVASSAYVYAADRILAVRRQDVTLELDRSRLFNSDQSEIRAVSRWDIAVPDPEVVVRVLGILA